MRRKTAHSSAASIQLFPFLAVLISTMGALVVLLFAFAKHGQNQAEKAAQATAAVQTDQEAVAAGEMLDWQLEQLRASREKTQQQLTERRAELSHVEDHLRRLRAEAERLELSIEQLAAASQGEGDPTQLEQRRQQILRQIEQTQRELEEKEQQRQAQPVTYSVVPYHGPNSTSRRPIYIECTKDAVIVQPEGIVLNDADFQPPLGPGNPLAAAIRAYGEYLSRAGFAEEQTKPYPMLLVRPDGIEAYYAARGALVSWGTEFGYELIASDWTLDFPTADPRLATALQDVVADARVRQQALAAAAPRQYMRSRSSGGLRASPNGRGFIREGGDDEGYGFARGSGRGTGGFGGGSNSGEPGALATGGFRNGGSGAQTGEPGADHLSAVPATGVSGNNGFGSPGTGAAAIPGNSSAFGDQVGGGTENSANGNFAAQQSGNPGGQNRYGGSEQGNSPDGVNGDANNGLAGSGTHNDRANTGNGGDASSGMASTSGQSSALGSPGGAQGANQGGAPGGAGSGSSDSAQSASGLPQVPLHAPRNTPNSVASRRGEDWGLPESSRGLIPVTRPVIVRCEANQLVIVPDDNRTDPRAINLPQRSEAAVDELVSNVWDHIKTWGTAGRGMYWKPMLVFDVAPGGEARFAEFQALLAGSGMEIKQRTRTAAQPTSPPRRR